MYAFAREPKWILSHLFVLILVVAMIGAGFWQLDRLQQKKDRNALVTERQEEPVAPIDEIVGADQPTDVGGDVRFRRSTATGTYDVAEQVLVRNRSFDGAPGSWVLTPLVLDDGTALVVNRGWVPVTGDLPVPPESAPPDGEVTVEGLLEESQSRGSFGPTDPSGEDLDTLSRVDLERYQEQVDVRPVPRVAAAGGPGPAARRASGADRAAGARRGTAPRLRGPVVHVHADRAHRLPADPAPPGPPGRPRGAGVNPHEPALEATLTCIARGGMQGFTVEDVAVEAGLSRATLYRWFPGGREQLVAETVTWEVGRFFARLAEAIDDAPDFRTRAERGLAFAHRTLRDHEAFQRAMAGDQGDIQARLAGIAPIVIGVIRSYLEPLLEQEDLVEGVTPAEAADYLARLIGSLIVDEGSWDLGDPAQVSELVDRWLLAGILVVDVR